MCPCCDAIVAPLEFWHSVSFSNVARKGAVPACLPPGRIFMLFPFPALNAFDSVARYAVLAVSEPAAAANDFNRAVSTSGSIAAHLSAVTSCVFPSLSFLSSSSSSSLSSFFLCPCRPSLAGSQYSGPRLFRVTKTYQRHSRGRGGHERVSRLQGFLQCVL